MSETEPTTIDVDGHRVPAAEADLFYNPDGSRVTDEQWDKRKAAREGDNSHLVPEDLRGELER